MLTERLAAAAAHVHAVEIDRGLRAGAGARSRRARTSSLHWGDAMKLDLAALDPAPTAMVANLPYSVATPLILRTIEELPRSRRWTVMVQREIADRLRAGARQPHLRLAERDRPARLRGASWCARSTRPSSGRGRGSSRRSSACAAPGPAPTPATRELVRAAFAHRRKSLARSLEHGRPGALAPARAALAELGLPEDARAEALAPGASSPPCRRSCCD